MYTKFENNPSRGFWVIALTPLRAAGGGRRVAGGGRLRRKTITSPDPSDTGDIIINKETISFYVCMYQRCPQTLAVQFLCRNMVWKYIIMSNIKLVQEKKLSRFLILVKAAIPRTVSIIIKPCFYSIGNNSEWCVSPMELMYWRTTIWGRCADAQLFHAITRDIHYLFNFDRLLDNLLLQLRSHITSFAYWLMLNVLHLRL